MPMNNPPETLPGDLSLRAALRLFSLPEVFAACALCAPAARSQAPAALFKPRAGCMRPLRAEGWLSLRRPHEEGRHA